MRRPHHHFLTCKAMKRFVLYIGLTILVLNVITGLLVSTYSNFNMLLNSFTIVITSIFIWTLWRTGQKKALKVALSFIFAFIGAIQFILGCFSPNRCTDNGCMIAIMVLFALEILLFIISYYISKSVK